MSLAQFRRDRRRYVRSLERAALRKTQNIAREVRNELADATPVDTGRLQSNWKINVGRRGRFDKVDLEFFRTSSTPAGRRARLTLQTISPRLNDTSASRIGGKLGQTFYVSNYTPYIVHVEEGHGAPSPKRRANKKFIRNTLARLRTRYRQ